METWLSGPGISRSYQALTGETRTAKTVVERSAAGDENALKVMDHYYETLAASLASVINLVDPDVVVLGGGLSNIQTVYDELPRRLPLYVFSDHVSTRVVQAMHGDSSGVRGAAWLWR